MLPDSLKIRAGPDPDAEVFEPGRDYQADLHWATVGRLPQGRIRANQPVWVSYRHWQLRLDSIVLTPQGQIQLRSGQPQSAALVRLRRRPHSGVQVPVRPNVHRPVTEGYCVVATRGGELPEVNDPSVTT
jgi:hypothetical protein